MHDAASRFTTDHQVLTYAVEGLRAVGNTYGARIILVRALIVLCQGQAFPMRSFGIMNGNHESTEFKVNQV
jgi:hypothetical protein